VDARTNAQTPNSHCGDYVEPYSLLLPFNIGKYYQFWRKKNHIHKINIFKHTL